jgi:hypothetical protein
MRVAGLLLVLLFAGPAPMAHAADEVVIYRCTDKAGHLTLSDTPCRKDQLQQTREMVRPRDPPATRGPAPHPGLQRSDDSSPRSEYAPVAPALVIQSPRAMYECTTPDGNTYTSDNAEGNPRWVPFWTLGYPIAQFRGGGSIAHDGLGANGMSRIGLGTDFIRATSGTTDITAQGIDNDITGLNATGLSTDLSVRNRHLQIEAHSRARQRFDGNAIYGGGTWVRDDCYALPQAESCARLSERRDAINRRFFNAMPNERDVLRVEERGISARLANDCGAY